MMDSLEDEIKSEIDKISRDIDAIIKKVEEHCPKEQGDTNTGGLNNPGKIDSLENKNR